MHTIGFDPEWFVQQKGAIRPACGVFGGTKEKPLELGLDGFTYHEDNVTLELQVPPATNEDDAANNLAEGIAMLQQVAKSKGYALSLGRDQYKFPMSQLRSKKANTFGCDADFMAYDGGTDPRKPLDPSDLNGERYAGGHIHIGGDFNCPPFVAALFMDIAVGANLAQQAKQLPVSKRPGRRGFYGAAGVFRPKPYGIEYRTPGSSWLKYDDVRYGIICRALGVARWLENNPATHIRAATTAINWLAVREFVDTGHRDADPSMYMQEIKTFRKYGGPV